MVKVDDVYLVEHKHTKVPFYAERVRIVIVVLVAFGELAWEGAVGVVVNFVNRISYLVLLVGRDQ